MTSAEGGNRLPPAARYRAVFVGGPRDGAVEVMDAQPSGEPHRERRFPVPPVIWTAPVSTLAVDDRSPLVELYRWRGRGRRRKWSFQHGDEGPKREWVYAEVVYEWVGSLP